MKRSREATILKRESSSEAVTFDTHLERMPHETFRHVCSFLGFADLHALYRAVIYVKHIDIEQESCYRRGSGGSILDCNTVPLLGGIPLHTDFESLDRGVRELCAEESTRIQRLVAFGTSEDLLPLGYRVVEWDEAAYNNCRRADGSFDGNAHSLLVGMRTHRNLTGSIKDPCYFTRMLRYTELCTCCHTRFGINAMWIYSNDPHYLCGVCQRAFGLTTAIGKKDLKLDSAWFWITPSHLKELCGVPSATRAEDFARLHGIRAQSNIGSSNTNSNGSNDNDGGGGRGKPRSDFYFYGDIVRYLYSK